MKKGIITFIGNAGVISNNNGYKLADKAFYQNNTTLDIKDGYYYSLFDLLLSNFKDFRIIAIHTEKSKLAQEFLLKQINMEYCFDDKYLIKNLADIKDIFRIINLAIKEFDEIIFDITHGFRSLPILAIINMIIENIVEKNKIKHILFAQEKEDRKKYELIDLVEYINIANLSIAVSSFLNTLKVPEYDLEDPLYKELKEYSKYFLSNQIKELIIQGNKLLEIINLNREKYYFMSYLLDELEKVIKKIDEYLNKDFFEQSLFLAELFLEKGYYLNSSTYMIEGYNYFLTILLQKLGIVDKNINPNEYNIQQEVVTTFLRMQKSKNFAYPNDYFLDINYEIISYLNKIREKITDIRHNLVHINLEKEYKDLYDKLKEVLDQLKQLSLNKIIKKFDITDRLKKYTLTYKFKELEKSIPTMPNLSKIKLNNLMNKYEKNELHTISNMGYQRKLKNFCIKNYKKYKKLMELKKEGKFLIIEKR